MQFTFMFELKLNQHFCKMPKIWIIGRGLYALNLARFIKNINKNDIMLCLLTTDAHDFAGWSKNFDQVIYIEFRPSTYFKDVYDIVKDNYAIPVGEETLFLEYGNYLEQNATNKINFLQEEHLHEKHSNKRSEFKNIFPIKIKYHNKMHFMNLVKIADIPCLKTFYCGNIVTVPKITKFLLKPIYSRGSIGQQIIIIDPANPYCVPQNYILQEYLENKNEYSVFCDIMDSKIESFVCYRCTTMHKGFGIKRELVENEYTNNVLKIYVQTLLDKATENCENYYYNGYLGIDFLETNNIFYATDFNPRITNGIGFLSGSKVIVSLIPYLFSNFNYNTIKECIVLDNDVFFSDDPLPGIFGIFLIIWYFFFALFSFQSIKNYIESKVKDQIITFDERYILFYK